MANCHFFSLGRVEAIFEVNTDLQKNVQTRVTAQLTWPSLVNSSKHIYFPLTNTNSSSVSWGTHTHTHTRYHKLANVHTNTQKRGVHKQMHTLSPSVSLSLTHTHAHTTILHNTPTPPKELALYFSSIYFLTLTPLLVPLRRRRWC